MNRHNYHFVTRWRVKSTVEEVSQILGNAPDLPRWWPAVYLDVQELEPGDERGLDKVVSLHTKGWLPYTLRWQFRATENRWPHGFSLQAWGDFVGHGVWTFEPEDDWVNISYDWCIQADKPLLKYLSFLLRPIFSANHHWAMHTGQQSLRLELARRHTTTPAAQAAIPAPPGPTNPAMFWLAGGVISAILIVFVWRLKRTP